MQKSITLIIPSNPVGKQRSRKGAHGNWYNPQSEDMRAAKLVVERQLPDKFVIIPRGVPIIVNTMFFFQPAKTEATQKFMQLIADETYPYIKKPDRDNCDKYILDILSKIVFFDDNQVFGGALFKYYTPDNPRTEIEVIW